MRASVRIIVIVSAVATAACMAVCMAADVPASAPAVGAPIAGTPLAGATPSTTATTQPLRLDGISKPSQDVTQSFMRPGIIGKINVKEGDRVAKDQVLVEMENSVEQIQVRQLKEQSEDTTKVRASEAQLAQKRVDLEKTQKAAKTGGATEMEVEHARLEVIIGELSVELAKFQLKQDVLKYEEARQQLERMLIRSSVNGSVQEKFIDIGSSVDANVKVIRVVCIDPMHIDVPVPRASAQALKKGEPATVIFDDGSKLDGAVIFKADVSDPASDTTRIRVEVLNKSLRPAGEHVMVEFSRPAGVSAAAVDTVKDTLIVAPATKPAVTTEPAAEPTTHP